MAFCSDDHVNVPATFEVHSFTRFWDNRGYLKILGSTWIRCSRSSKVADFGTNRKPVLVGNSNLGPILHCFGVIAGFCAPDWPHPYSALILGCSRCTRSPMLGSARADALSYSAVKLFSKNSNLCDHGHRQTDRQTDRQTPWRTDRRTIYCGITALCVASRGKDR